METSTLNADIKAALDRLFADAIIWHGTTEFSEACLAAAGGDLEPITTMLSTCYAPNMSATIARVDLPLTIHHL